MTPVITSNATAIMLGYPVPTVDHQKMRKIKIPIAFMPIGVKGSTGGKKRKRRKNKTPSPGSIHCFKPGEAFGNALDFVSPC